MSQIKMSWSWDNPLQFSSVPDTKQAVVCQYGLEAGTIEEQMKSLTEMGMTSIVPDVLFWMKKWWVPVAMYEPYFLVLNDEKNERLSGFQLFLWLMIRSMLQTTTVSQISSAP